jgi:cell division transport system permease protein
MRAMISNFIKTWQIQPAIQLASLSVLVATFTIMTTAFAVHHNLHALLTRWGSEVRLSIYLKDEALDEGKSDVEMARTLAPIKAALDGSSLFSEIQFLSKQGAAQLFREKMGQLSSTLTEDKDFLNPLPASYEAKLKSAIAGSADYQKFVDFSKSIVNMPGVEEVSYGQGWIENYAAALRVFTTSSYFLIAVLLMAGLFVVANSVRSSISVRRDEIAILELFGATTTMVQWPYIFEGMMMGFMSSTMAVVLSYGLFAWAKAVWVEQLGFWSSSTRFEFLSVGNVSAILFAGILMGGAASYLCVRRINTGWAAAESGGDAI